MKLKTLSNRLLRSAIQLEFIQAITPPVKSEDSCHADTGIQSAPTLEENYIYLFKEMSEAKTSLSPSKICSVRLQKSLLLSVKCVCLFLLGRRKKIPLFDSQKYCSFETFPILDDDENKMLRFLMVILSVANGLDTVCLAVKLTDRFQKLFFT